MSIQGEINRLLTEKSPSGEPVLCVLRHSVQGQKIERFIIASQEVAKAVAEPFPSGKTGKRLARMKQKLDSFMAGDWISVSEDPRDKPPNTDLSRVDPVVKEVWDIRCLSAKIRVFGRFSERDHFVALTYEDRGDLRGGGFDRARERFIETWRNLFPNEPIFGANHISQYLKRNYHVVGAKRR